LADIAKLPTAFEDGFALKIAKKVRSAFQVVEGSFNDLTEELETIKSLIKELEEEIRER